jgi:hypothetical protein
MREQGSEPSLDSTENMKFVSPSLLRHQTQVTNTATLFTTGVPYARRQTTTPEIDSLG